MARWLIALFVSLLGGCAGAYDCGSCERPMSETAAALARLPVVAQWPTADRATIERAWGGQFVGRTEDASLFVDVQRGSCVLTEAADFKGGQFAGVRMIRSEATRDAAFTSADAFVAEIAALRGTLESPLVSGPADFRRLTWLLPDDEHGKRQLIVTSRIEEHRSCWIVEASARLFVFHTSRGNE